MSKHRAAVRGGLGRSIVKVNGVAIANCPTPWPRPGPAGSIPGAMASRDAKAGLEISRLRVQRSGIRAGGVSQVACLGYALLPMTVPKPGQTDADGATVEPIGPIGVHGRSASPGGTGLDLAAYLGPDATFRGTLSLAGNVRLDGTLEGDLLGASHVTLGPTARVEGRISARTVVVVGSHVEAEVHASEAIELRDGAYVKGDLRAPHVHMDPDIEFHGRCDMTPLTRPPGPIETSDEGGAARERSSRELP